MSVTIRLAKFGKRNAPSYRVVVSNTRNKRNGKYLDILGFYNPSDPSSKFTYDKKRYEDWIKKGALITTAVEKLVAGKYKFKKYEPTPSAEASGQESEESEVSKKAPSTKESTNEENKE